MFWLLKPIHTAATQLNWTEPNYRSEHVQKRQMPRSVEFSSYRSVASVNWPLHRSVAVIPMIDAADVNDVVDNVYD